MQTEGIHSWERCLYAEVCRGSRKRVQRGRNAQEILSTLSHTQLCTKDSEQTHREVKENKKRTNEFRAKGGDYIEIAPKWCCDEYSNQSGIIQKGQPMR